MNPMLFGIEIPDTKTPIVTGVYAYAIGDDAEINQSQNRTKLRLILQKNGNYKAESLTAYGKIGFGITTYDQMDGASNKNGVYSINTTFNGTEKFEVRFNKFSFAETRYLNRYIDYGYYKTNRSRIQKLFREPDNPLSLIVKEDQHGFINVEDNLDSVYTIAVKDFKGNTRFITIPIEGKKLEILDPRNIEKTDNYIYANQATSITKGKFSVYIPANALYENAYLNIEAKGDTLTLHKDVIPIHRNITITADISNYKKDDKDKLFIGRLNYRGEPYYVDTKRKKNKLIARTRTFGDYIFTSDTTVPVIKPLNFSDGKWITKNKTLKVKITDALSGISTYRGTLNGKFILMEYNYKTDVLTYDFDDDVNPETENNLKLIVIDNVGNSATFEAKFFRKQT
jgi:hypothetical protein